MDGWALPPGSRTWHAYAGDWSLCRRQSPAPTALRGEPGEPVCLACRKAAILRRVMRGVERAELEERAEALAWTPPPGQRPPRKPAVAHLRGYRAPGAMRAPGAGQAKR